MHRPSTMNVRQSLRCLQRNLPRNLPPQSSTPIRQPRTLIKHLDTRATHLAYHTKMMSIRAIDPEMVQHTHHIPLSSLAVLIGLFTFPQTPQDLDFRTIT